MKKRLLIFALFFLLTISSTISKAQINFSEALFGVVEEEYQASREFLHLYNSAEFRWPEGVMAIDWLVYYESLVIDSGDTPDIVSFGNATFLYVNNKEKIMIPWTQSYYENNRSGITGGFVDSNTYVFYSTFFRQLPAKIYILTKKENWTLDSLDVPKQQDGTEFHDFVGTRHFKGNKLVMLFSSTFEKTVVMYNIRKKGYSQTGLTDLKNNPVFYIYKTSPKIDNKKKEEN